MKFIVDAQLPPALARFLASKGEDVIHVLDVQMMESSDGSKLIPSSSPLALL